MKTVDDAAFARLPAEYAREERAKAEEYMAVQRAAGDAKREEAMAPLARRLARLAVLDGTPERYFFACGVLLGVLALLASVGITAAMTVSSIAASPRLLGAGRVLACIGGGVGAALGGAAVGAVVGIVAGFIGAHAVGVCGFPLLYPVYLLLCRLLAPYVRRAEGERAAAEARLSATLEAELSAYRRETEARIAAYEAAYRAEVGRLCERYAEAPLVTALAVQIGGDLSALIGAEGGGRVHVRVSVLADCVCWLPAAGGEGRLTFAEAGLLAPCGMPEQIALLTVLCNHSIDSVRARDTQGGELSVHFDLQTADTTTLYSCPAAACATLTYTPT